MRQIFSLAIAGCLLTAAVPAYPQVENAAQSAPSVEANYQLGPGDVLDVTVATHQGFNVALTVQPDGRIHYPFIGEIVVSGLTVPELTRRIREGLEKELKHPQVNVSIRQVRPGATRVTITGAVRTQVGVDLRPNWRVSDAILAAGGPTDRADLTRVTLWHEGRPETLDLSPLKVDGRLERNPLLSTGDVLVVPERERLTVSVTGEGVRSQGSFELDDPEPTVLKALQKAGGHLDKADLKRAQFMRAGQPPRPLDLEALVLKGDMSLNLPLKNGDAIHVPTMEDKAYVFGEVLKPDAVPLKPGMRILDALSAAAPTREANLDRAVLVRKEAGGEPKATELKLSRLQKGDLTVNLALQNGDVLLVPRKGKKFTVQDMLQYLYPIDILRRMFQLGF